MGWTPSSRWRGSARSTDGSAAAGPWRSTAWIWSSRAAACSASSGRTAPARRPRSGASSVSSVRPEDGAGCSARNPRGLHKVIGRVGSIVESPAMYPRFSATRNLELLGRISRIGRTRVREVLDQVGLAERADDHVKTYSLGMKQRLGIAGALLKDPEVLILDEPANGLDPAGIVEVRELMRRLGNEGRTVFVSSHILNEVQQTADRVSILARGRQVATGPVREVLSAGHAAGLLVRLDDVAAGLRTLGEAGIDARADDGFIRVGLPPADAARVTRTLADRGLYLTELRADEADLETVFLELTGGA